MIHVKRVQDDELGARIEPAKGWFTRAERRTQDTNAEFNPAAPTAEIKVKDTYKSASVKKALERLFNGKCAYCEWPPGVVSDWDVEHFRPKGNVAEAPDHPGYYWLAYTWENLYYSCMYCNQVRKDPCMWADSVARGAARGKLDQFPLGDDGTRVESHLDVTRSLDNEDRLLIDPCDDDPTEHLGFEITGELDDRGEKSIEVFNLNRRRLVKLRQRHLTLVVDLLRLEKDLLANGDAVNTGRVRAILDAHYLAASAPFAGLARAIDADKAAFGV